MQATRPGLVVMVLRVLKGSGQGQNGSEFRLRAGHRPVVERMVESMVLVPQGMHVKYFEMRLRSYSGAWVGIQPAFQLGLPRPPVRPSPITLSRSHPPLSGLRPLAGHAHPHDPAPTRTRL